MSDKKPESLGSYVIDQLYAYRVSALARDPKFFDHHENVQAYIQFQMQVIAIWLSEMQRDMLVSDLLMPVMPKRVD